MNEKEVLKLKLQNGNGNHQDYLPTNPMHLLERLEVLVELLVFKAREGFTLSKNGVPVVQVKFLVKITRAEVFNSNGETLVLKHQGHYPEVITMRLGEFPSLSHDDPRVLAFSLEAFLETLEALVRDPDRKMSLSLESQRLDFVVELVK